MADRLRKITIRKKLMQELIDTVAEVYETTNEIKTTAMELSLLQGKVKKLHDYLWDSISVRDTADCQPKRPPVPYLAASL